MRLFDHHSRSQFLQQFYDSNAGCQLCQTVTENSSPFSSILYEMKQRIRHGNRLLEICILFLVINFNYEMEPLSSCIVASDRTENYRFYYHNLTQNTKIHAKNPITHSFICLPLLLIIANLLKIFLVNQWQIKMSHRSSNQYHYYYQCCAYRENRDEYIFCRLLFCTLSVNMILYYSTHNTAIDVYLFLFTVNSHMFWSRNSINQLKLNSVRRRHMWP